MDIHVAPLAIFILRVARTHAIFILR